MLSMGFVLFMISLMAFMSRVGSLDCAAIWRKEDFQTEHYTVSEIPKAVWSAVRQEETP